MTIIEMLPIHWVDVKQIYEEGMATDIATFQTEAPSWEEWDKAHLSSCRFVAIIDDKIVGWVALSAVSTRPVYAGVAEVSIYVAEGNRGNRIGDALMKHLIKESEAQGIWTLQSGIFRQNFASIELHKKNGFRNIGYRERIGKRNNTWFDNVLMERRSSIVGIE